MTPFQRKSLTEHAESAIAQYATPRPSDAAQVGFQHGSLVIVNPHTLLELLDATEERTVPRRESS